ncbi:hypothetical protein QEZ54_27285 [Catellatospora sp. KI3]|uniref:hypothetical protein n=1 Tax=Catellatospora sp. KI3 TaxID=3041620 RepID=UPI0024821191|nr:hypothetical protein [Catellatospora sp. KI3]MDI1464680.1 hypothetical protein [Catellatospora sp. KI3]
MRFFDSAARHERKLQRLQDRADDYGARAMTLLRAGHAEEAVQPSRQAIETILRLRRLEPGNQAHLAQLASKLYNHSAILDHAEHGPEAVAVARHAYEAYLELSGGEINPQVATLDRIIPRRVPINAGSAVPDLATAAAFTADAKSRLAFMLAKWGGPDAAAEARRLATEAVDTYQHLTNLGTAGSDDFLRVVTRYDQVCRLLEARE